MDYSLGLMISSVVIFGIVLVVLALFAAGLRFVIVPANECHVRIMLNKISYFSKRENKSSYWKIPVISKVHRLPLSNLAVPVNDIKLNDKDMAKFVCDVVCFITIKDLPLAVERLMLTTAETEMGFDFAKLGEDFRAIIESVGRTTVTKSTILEIYMNRQILDDAITKEVQSVFPKWGVELIDLELKDLKDAPESTIIQDIERKVAAEIRRDAEIRVATTTKEAEVAKAEAEEIYRKRQIEKDKQIGIAGQQMMQKVAEEEVIANIQKVEAKRKLTVGSAEIEKQVIEQQAQAAKIKAVTVAEGEAKAVEIKAEAEKARLTAEGEGKGKAIQSELLGEAEGISKKADALKKYEEAAKLSLILDALKPIAEALGRATEKIKIDQVVAVDSGGEPSALNRVTTALPKTVAELMSTLAAVTGVDIRKMLQECINKPETDPKKS
ncbi:MAG: hypothetical protein KKA64_02675 [Nanoarchaeota archaeon]|nr:hypothetical protein [Nanoarchaeota archaeon]